MKPLKNFYRKGVPLISRGQGLFKIGEQFKTPDGHTLTIIEIVAYGMYPNEHPKLRVYGYFRQHESYVVRDESGNRRWPLVGSLLKMEKVK